MIWNGETLVPTGAPRDSPSPTLLDLGRWSAESFPPLIFFNLVGFVSFLFLFFSFCISFIFSLFLFSLFFLASYYITCYVFTTVTCRFYRYSCFLCYRKHPSHFRKHGRALQPSRHIHQPWAKSTPATALGSWPGSQENRWSSSLTCAAPIQLQWTELLIKSYFKSSCWVNDLY